MLIVVIMYGSMCQRGIGFFANYYLVISVARGIVFYFSFFDFICSFIFDGGTTVSPMLTLFRIIS